MDPLSIATASASLAALAFNLARGLNDCIDQVKSAKDALVIFSAELSSLEKTLWAVETSMKHSKLQSALQKAVAAEDATAQLANLYEILRDCRTAFQDLEALISGIKSGKLAQGALSSPTIAWRLNSKAPRLGRLQNLLRTYKGTMQIHLQIVNLFISTDATLAAENIDKSLSDIKDEILSMRFELQKIQDPESFKPTKNARENNTIKVYLSSSEHVLSSASEYFGSTVGTIRANQSIAHFNSDEAARVREWVIEEDASDPTRSSEDYDEVELISEFAIVAEERFVVDDFAGAQGYLEKFLNRAQSLNSWDSREIYEAQMKLVLSYTAQGQYSAADKLLKSMLASVAEQKSQIQQHRAEVALMLSDIPLAKECAEQAKKEVQRAKHRTAYYNSMSLLAIISRMQGEDEEATVYQRRIPDDFSPTRILGWVEPGGTHGDSSPGKKAEDLHSSQENWTALPLIIHEAHRISAIAFSLDGSKLACGSRSRTLRVYDSWSGRLLHDFMSIENGVYKLAFSPSGFKLAVTTHVGVLQLWSFSGEKVWSDYKITSPLGVAFSTDGTRIAAARPYCKIIIWDVESGSEQQNIELGTHNSCSSLAWIPDQNILVSGTIGGLLLFCDTDTGQILQQVTASSHEPVMAVRASSDGELFLSSYYRWVKIWDRSGRKRRELTWNGVAVIDVTFSSDGQRVLGCTVDGTICIWDTISGKLLGSHPIFSDAAFDYEISVASRGGAFSSDGGRFAASNKDKGGQESVYIFDRRL